MVTSAGRRTRLVFVGAIAAQRLAELVWSRRNERRLRARGAVEHDRRGYPAMVALHVGWLAAMAAETSWASPASRQWRLVGVAALVAAQPLRYWAIWSLGDRWTTRVLVPPAEPSVAAGPYRFIAHPNYVAVATEIAAAPLAIGAWRTAAVASILDALVLRRRVRVETAALLGTDPGSRT
jgi:methyltransferase